MNRHSEDAQLYAEAIVRTVRQPLLVLSGDLVVETANPAFYRTFKVGQEETEGRPIYELGNGQWDIPGLRELLENVLPSDGHVEDFRVEHDFQEIGRRVMLLNAHSLERADCPDRILLAIDDITERERVRYELEGQKEFADKVVDASRDALAARTFQIRIVRGWRSTPRTGSTQKAIGRTCRGPFADSTPQTSISADWEGV